MRSGAFVGVLALLVAFGFGEAIAAQPEKESPVNKPIAGTKESVRGGNKKEAKKEYTGGAAKQGFTTQGTTQKRKQDKEAIAASKLSEPKSFGTSSANAIRVDQLMKQCDENKNGCLDAIEVDRLRVELRRSTVPKDDIPPPKSELIRMRLRAAHGMKPSTKGIGMPGRIELRPSPTLRARG